MTEALLEGRTLSGTQISHLIEEVVAQGVDRLVIRDCTLDSDLVLPPAEGLPSIRLEASTVGGTIRSRTSSAGGIELLDTTVHGAIQLIGAHLDGGLDVRNCDLGGLQLLGTELRHLTLAGGKVGGAIGKFAVQARRLHTRDDVAFQDVEVQGTIDLPMAVIGGVFLVERATLSGPEGRDALNCDATQVGGGVGIHKSSVAGPVRLSSIQAQSVVISGTFDSRGDDRYALHLQSSKIRGSLHAHGLSAVGAVDVSSAEIDDSVEFDGAVLDGRGRNALTLQSSTVGGNVFLRNGFAATGAINLCAASVTGHVELGRAALRGAVWGGTSGAGGPVAAILGRGLQTARLALGPESCFEGAVDFADATVTGDIFVEAKFEGALPPAPALSLRSVNAGGLDIRAETEVIGLTDLSLLATHRASIDGASFTASEEGGLVLRAESMGLGELIYSPSNMSGLCLFTGSNVRLLGDEPESWSLPGCTYRLDGFQFDRVLERSTGAWSLDARLRWLESDQRKDTSWAPVRALATSLRNERMEVEARAVLIRAHDREANRLTQLFVGRTTGYGYQLSNVYRWLAALFVAAALTIGIGVGLDAYLPADQPATPTATTSDSSAEVSASPSIADVTLISIDTVVPLLEIPEASQWRLASDGEGQAFALILAAFRLAGFVLGSIGLTAITLYGREWGS